MVIRPSIESSGIENIIVSVKIKGPTCKVVVKDDGVGFDSKKKENKKGLGMKNIESRVEILQGKYKIETAVNEGFKITINL